MIVSLILATGEEQNGHQKGERKSEDQMWRKAGDRQLEERGRGKIQGVECRLSSIVFGDLTSFHR